MALRVSLLGEVAITADPLAGSCVLRPRQLAMAFAYLVLHRDRPVTRDELADALWDDRQPQSWETALRVVLSKLRAKFAAYGFEGAVELHTSGRTYRLVLPVDVAVDVEEAAAAVTNAEAALTSNNYLEATALAGLGGKLASASLLTGEDARWLDERRRELAGYALRALETQAQAAIGQGDWLAAAAAAHKRCQLVRVVLHEHGLDEPAHHSLTFHARHRSPPFVWYLRTCGSQRARGSAGDLESPHSLLMLLPLEFATQMLAPSKAIPRGAGPLA